MFLFIFLSMIKIKELDEFYDYLKVPFFRWVLLV